MLGSSSNLRFDYFNVKDALLVEEVKLRLKVQRQWMVMVICLAIFCCQYLKLNKMGNWSSNYPNCVKARTDRFSGNGRKS